VGSAGELSNACSRARCLRQLQVAARSTFRDRRAEQDELEEATQREVDAGIGVGALLEGLRDHAVRGDAALAGEQTRCVDELNRDGPARADLRGEASGELERPAAEIVVPAGGAL
jgi:hypothetical protein